MKTPAVIAIVLVVALAAFGAGWYASGALEDDGGSVAVTGEPGLGGGLGRLSEEDRAKVQAMTPEERDAFMQEQFGEAVPPGVEPGAPGRGMRGGMLEGEVIEVASDTITVALVDGGSVTVYTSSDTVVAYAEGVESATLAEGQSVSISTVPEADGVTSATMVVVLE
ncbi:MAG: hypothetical protein GWP04_12750 [Gammaproteobacteria bacterium]|nr:hypothetical protein [Gammaproteobacteria bacterium]